MESDYALNFMTDLSIEMMNSGALVELEKFKLAGGKMGVNFDNLRDLAEISLDEALVNFKDVLDRDLKVLSNQAFDVDEKSYIFP